MAVNARVIGANEHESHYVFDIIYNNTSDIVPHIHSTDTHGINKVNYAILHIFGYEFAPRYKNLPKRKGIIYCFRHLNKYKKSIIKPTGKINKRLITEEWDNIQRIIASLALKDTTQSIIVSKLSSYIRRNRIKKALWEYDNIIKSFQNLKYIDNIQHRQNVQRVLNRGESFNKLFRAIPYADGGSFRVKNPEEQKILNECCRLIANSIIYYNMCILSELLAESEKEKNAELVTIIKEISPIAWQHINLYGRYEFNRRSGKVDINKIISELMIRTT